MSLLVGDIGGTNIRLRLVSENAACDIIHCHTYDDITLHSAANFVSTVKDDFLVSAAKSPDFQKPTRACFAVAGPVADGCATLTNRSLTLKESELESALQINSVSLINDFTAVCHGVRHIDPSDQNILQVEQAGTPDPSAPIAVIGAGTGLGQGFIIPNGDSYQVYPSEGGHADFAPNSSLEVKLWQYLRQHLGGHVSAERVISGQGITAIYQVLHEQEEFPESPASEEIRKAIQELRKWRPQGDKKKPDPSALISKAAQAQKDPDPLCVAVMHLFVKAYAAEARNLALKLLPYGGLYIAGGIITKNLSFFENGQFRRTFIQGGSMSHLLSKIPVHLVKTAEIGLMGAMYAPPSH
jgi:glucokinase